MIVVKVIDANYPSRLLSVLIGNSALSAFESPERKIVQFKINDTFGKAIHEFSTGEVLVWLEENYSTLFKFLSKLAGCDRYLRRAKILIACEGLEVKEKGNYFLRLKGEEIEFLKLSEYLWLAKTEREVIIACTLTGLHKFLKLLEGLG